MTKELENKIHDWLEKQGYPLEMLVASKFREIDAGISQSTYYIDPETEKPREIDVVVRWNKFEQSPEQNPDGVLEFQLFLFIECKSQQKAPWIIFSNGVKDKLKFLSMSLPATYDGHILLVPSVLYPDDSSPRMNSMQASFGYGVTQAFESKADIPYQGLMSCVKASIAEIRRIEKFRQETPRENVAFPLYMHAAIAIPIVVTDATLFECYLDKSNSPVLNEVTSYCLEWKYPLETGFHLSHDYAYIYNAGAIDQLVEDVKELRDELFARLRPLLEARIAEHKSNSK